MVSATRVRCLLIVSCRAGIVNVSHKADDVLIVFTLLFLLPFPIVRHHITTTLKASNMQIIVNNSTLTCVQVDCVTGGARVSDGAVELLEGVSNCCRRLYRVHALHQLPNPLRRVLRLFHRH